MRKLLLNKGKYLIHQSKTQTKNRLGKLNILKNIKNNQINIEEQQSKQSVVQIKDNNNATAKLNIQNLVDFSQKGIKKYSYQTHMNKLLFKNYKTVGNFINEDFNYEKKDQEKSQFSHSRWIRNILLILFFAKVFQHQKVRCDYDINDMIATIQLQQQEMLVEEEEKEKQKEKRQQEEKAKQNERKQEQESLSEEKQSQKQMGNDKRYGTEEQMLKQQMDNSEEFGSVEQRMFIKQVEQSKHNESQNDTINILQQKQVSSIENPIVEMLIQQLIQNQEKTRKQQNLTSQSQSIEEKQGQQKQQQIQSKVEQQTLQLNAETKIAQMKNQKITVTQVSEKKQNHGTIQFTSDQFLPLSIRLQNFLGLRGVKVAISQLKTDQSQENSQSKKGIQLNLCNKIMDCKEIHLKKQSNDRDVFHHLNNFLNPPHIINSIEQAKQLLKIIQKDQNIISTYIPQKSSSQNKQSNPFDTFSSRYPQPDPSIAEKQFREYKYLSSSKKNCFVIVRNKQTAEYLKVSTSKIGVPHVLYKYDKQLNGRQSQPNCQIDGDFYHVVQNFDKLIVKQGLNTTDKASQKINQLTERGFTLINSAEDMYDKIRQLKQQSAGFSFQQQNINDKQKSPMKKLFIIKLNDSKSEKEINGILEKLSRMNKKQVSIVKTQSQLLLKSLGVVSNEEYATIRLFDLQQRQQPVIKSEQTQSGQFLRYVPRVPFQIQFLSKWISNISPYDKPHEEQDHSVNKLRASHPGDFETVKQQGKMKLVLFYKQGCKGCKLMQDLLSRIVELKQRLRQDNNQSAKRIRREICLRYRIQDLQHIREIQISKFNILNDDKSIQVPQTTPTIYLFDGKNKQKVILKTEQIFNHLNKINTNNEEIVQDYMVRDLIDEIERGYRRFQSLY